MLILRILVQHGLFSVESINSRLYSIDYRYASPKSVTRVANFTLYAMAYLAWSEFTEVEKSGKLGVLV